MAERRPLVVIDGVTQELPQGDTTPGSGSGGGGGTPHYFRAIANGTQNAVNNVVTRVIFQTEQTDTMNGYDETTGIYTHPVGAGTQTMVFMAGARNNDSAGTYYLRINGTIVSQVGGSSTNRLNVVSGPIVMNEGDTADVAYFFSNTSALEASNTWFGGVYLNGGGSGSMTDAEVKTAYENNADTNAFTDAEKTKLGNIEASATADQTGAEIVSAIDTELGNTDWKTGGSGGGGGTWGPETAVPREGTLTSSSGFATKGNFIEILKEGRITAVNFSTGTSHAGEVVAAIVSGRTVSDTFDTVSKEAYASAVTGSGETNTVTLTTPLDVQVGDIVFIGVTRTDGGVTTNPNVYYKTGASTDNDFAQTPSGIFNMRLADTSITQGQDMTNTEYFSDNWAVGYSYQEANISMTNEERVKLAAIEDNATADQTGAEIEALLDAELGSTDWKTGGSGVGGQSGGASSEFLSHEWEEKEVITTTGGTRVDIDLTGENDIKLIVRGISTSSSGFANAYLSADGGTTLLNDSLEYEFASVSGATEASGATSAITFADAGTTLSHEGILELSGLNDATRNTTIDLMVGSGASNAVVRRGYRRAAGVENTISFIVTAGTFDAMDIVVLRRKRVQIAYDPYIDRKPMTKEYLGSITSVSNTPASGSITVNNNPAGDVFLVGIVGQNQGIYSGVTFDGKAGVLLDNHKLATYDNVAFYYVEGVLGTGSKTLSIEDTGTNYRTLASIWQLKNADITNFEYTGNASVLTDAVLAQTHEGRLAFVMHSTEGAPTVSTDLVADVADSNYSNTFWAGAYSSDGLTDNTEINHTVGEAGADDRTIAGMITIAPAEVNNGSQTGAVAFTYRKDTNGYFTPASANSWEVVPLATRNADPYGFDDGSTGFIVPAGVTKIELKAFIQSNGGTNDNQWNFYVDGVAQNWYDGFTVNEINEDAYSNGGENMVSGTIDVTPGQVITLWNYQSSTTVDHRVWVEIKAVEHSLVGALPQRIGNMTPIDLPGLNNVSIENPQTADLNRPVGLTGFGSNGAPTFGLLADNTQLLGGGAEILVDYDFAVDGNTDTIIVPNVDQYETVRIVGFGLDMPAVFNYELSNDGGTTSVSVQTARARGFANASSAIVASITAQASATNHFFFTHGDGTAAAHGAGEFTGFSEGLIVCRREVWTDQASLYWHDQNMIHEATGINAIKFICAGGNITAGRFMAIGVKKVVTPVPLTVDYVGTPAQNGNVGRIISPYPTRLKAGTYSHFRVSVAPSPGETLELVNFSQASAVLGTITWADGALTGSLVVGSDVDIDEGDTLLLQAKAATPTFVDMIGTIRLELR